VKNGWVCLEVLLHINVFKAICVLVYAQDVGIDLILKTLTCTTTHIITPIFNLKITVTIERSHNFVVNHLCGPALKIFGICSCHLQLTYFRAHLCVEITYELMLNRSIGRLVY